MSVFAIHSPTNITVLTAAGELVEGYSIAYLAVLPQYVLQCTHYLRDNVLSCKTTQQFVTVNKSTGKKLVRFVEGSIDHGAELIKKGWAEYDDVDIDENEVTADVMNPYHDAVEVAPDQDKKKLSRTKKKFAVAQDAKSLKTPLGPEAHKEDPAAVDALGLHMINTVLEGYVETMYSPTEFDLRTMNNFVFRVRVCGLTTDAADLANGMILRKVQGVLLHRFICVYVEEYDSTKCQLLVNPATDMYPYAEFLQEGSVRVDPSTLAFAGRFNIDKVLKCEDAEIAAMDRNHKQEGDHPTNIWAKEEKNFNRDEVLQFRGTVVQVLSHKEIIVAKESLDNSSIQPAYYNVRLPFLSSTSGNKEIHGSFPGVQIAKACSTHKIQSHQDVEGGAKLSDVRGTFAPLLYTATLLLNNELMGAKVDVTPMHSYDDPVTGKRIRYGRVSTMLRALDSPQQLSDGGVEPALDLLFRGLVELEPLDLYPSGICLQPSTDYYQCASKGQSKLFGTPDGEMHLVGGLGDEFPSFKHLFDAVEQVQRDSYISCMVFEVETFTQLIVLVPSPLSNTVHAIRVSAYGAIAPEVDYASEEYGYLFTEVCKKLGRVQVKLRFHQETKKDADGNSVPEVSIRCHSRSKTVEEQQDPPVDYVGWLLSLGGAVLSGARVADFDANYAKMVASMEAKVNGIWSPRGAGLLAKLKADRQLTTGATITESWSGMREGHVIHVESGNDFYVWWIDILTNEKGSILTEEQDNLVQEAGAVSHKANLKEISLSNVVLMRVNNWWYRALVSGLEPNLHFVLLDQFVIGGISANDIKPDDIRQFAPESCATLESLPLGAVVHATHAFLDFVSEDGTIAQETAKAATKEYINMAVVDVVVEYVVNPPGGLKSAMPLCAVSMIPKDALLYPSTVALLKEFPESELLVNLKLCQYVSRFSDKMKRLQEVTRPIVGKKPVL